MFDISLVDNGAGTFDINLGTGGGGGGILRVLGVSIASISSISGVSEANIKSVSGVSNV